MLEPGTGEGKSCGEDEEDEVLFIFLGLVRFGLKEGIDLMDLGLDRDGLF